MRKKINRNAVVFKNRMDAKIKKIAKMRGGQCIGENCAISGSQDGLDNQNTQNAFADSDSRTEQIMTDADVKAKEQINIENTDLKKQQDELMKLINNKNKAETSKATAGVVDIKDLKVQNNDKVFVANVLSRVLKISGKVGASIPGLKAATDSLSKAVDSYKDYVQIKEIILSLKECVFFAVRLISLIRITKVIFDTTIEQTVLLQVQNADTIAKHKVNESEDKPEDSTTQAVPSDIAIEVEETPNKLLYEMLNLQFVPEIEYQILAKLDAIKILLRPYDTAKTIEPNVYRNMISKEKKTMSEVISKMNIDQIPENIQRMVIVPAKNVPNDMSLVEYYKKISDGSPLMSIVNAGLNDAQISLIIEPVPPKSIGSVTNYVMRGLRSVNTIRLSFKASSVIQTLLKELTLLNPLLFLYNSQFDWIIKSYEHLIATHLDQKTLERIWEIIRETKEYKAYLSKDAPPIEVPTTVEAELNMLFDGAINKLKNIGSKRSIKEMIKTAVSIGLGLVESGATDSEIDTSKMETSMAKMEDKIIKTHNDTAKNFIEDPSIKTLNATSELISNDVGNFSAAATVNSTKDMSLYQRGKNLLNSNSSTAVTQKTDTPKKGIFERFAAGSTKNNRRKYRQKTKVKKYKKTFTHKYK